MSSGGYVLGHSAQELERLQRQGAYLAPLTREVLRRGGVGPGMRVMDFGAGTGDVTLLVSELVGPNGQVVAVERSAEALSHARARVHALGLTNVVFVEGDEQLAQEHANPRGFDAVVGRLVLLHQKDLGGALARLSALVRPGGMVAFHEIDMNGGIWSSPELPLLKQVFGWICTTFQRGGMPGDISLQVKGELERLGFQGVTVLREGRLESGPSSGVYDWFSNVTRTLLPAMEKMKVATPGEVGIDTLAERLREEATARQACFIPVMFMAAWARKPNG